MRDTENIKQNINLQNMDLSSLEGLSPEEKKLVFSILKEMAAEGTSKTYEAVLEQDYAEIPVDIITFVDDYNYLGNAWHDVQGNSKLYPYWRRELKKLFPTNIDTNVNNVILSGSRGRGKTEIAILIAAYLLHRILCLKNPIEYFHLKSTEKIVFAFMNIKLALAEEIADSKFQNTIKSSPWFLEHGKLEGRTKKVWVPQTYINSNGEEQIAVDIKIGSQADDLIGLPIYYCLEGNTEILTSDGVFKIKDLENKKIKVPTVDAKNSIILSDECTVKQTNKSDVEYEIQLEDDTIIKCTPNHRFRLVDGTYKEAQYLTADDELADYAVKPFGYIYKFTNLKTNKIYIGKREKSVFDEHYYGSGKLWKSDLEKYGKENIKREILCFGFSREELNELEKYYIKLYNTQDEDVGYNIHKGGQGGNSINDTEKWSEMHKGAKNGRYHKEVTLETRLKISAATKGLNKGVKNPKKGRPGKPKPPGFGDKISAYLTGRVKTGDALINIRKGNKITALKNKGKQIYNNGINEKRFFPNDIIPEGYIKGRLFKKPRKVKDPETQIKRGNSNENKKY